MYDNGRLKQANPAPSPARPEISTTKGASHIETAYERHAKGLDTLLMGLDVLTNRLNKVLRPQPQPPSGSGGQDASAPLAPLAALIHQHADQVDVANRVIEDILSRLEL